MASFIRRDILEPHVRDFIRRSSQLFGEREIPEIIDWGTTHDGNTFYIGAFVPYYTHHQETKLVIHVAQMDGDYHVHELETPPTSSW
jgi:hypothetical protein